MLRIHDAALHVPNHTDHNLSDSLAFSSSPIKKGLVLRHCCMCSEMLVADVTMDPEGSAAAGKSITSFRELVPCLYIRMYTYIYTYIYVYKRLYVYTYVCVCLYTYIYIICIHTRIS